MKLYTKCAMFAFIMFFGTFHFVSANNSITQCKWVATLEDGVCVCSDKSLDPSNGCEQPCWWKISGNWFKELKSYINFIDSNQSNCCIDKAAIDQNPNMLNSYNTNKWSLPDCDTSCNNPKWWVIIDDKCQCQSPSIEFQGECITNTEWALGIECNNEQLINWQCKFNINETLGIKQWSSATIGEKIQDIILSATFFIWTIITIVIIYTGLMYVFSWASGQSPDKYKQWLINALIWLLIVSASYAIIRLVQYIAKGW